MITKKIEINVRREFSEDFKKSCVKDYETGQLTVKDLAKLHHLQRAVIYRWIYLYSVYNKRRIRVVEMADSSKLKIKELHKRVEELERIVGQKQLNIDFLEKMVELAKEHYGIDIKKNFDTPPSTGSEKTSTK